VDTAEDAMGDPDLQGIYTSDDYMDTPLERPTAFGERLYFTEEELAEAAAKLAKQAEADLQGTLQTKSGPSRYVVGEHHELVGEKRGPDGPRGKRRSSWIRRTEKCLH